MNEDTFTPLLNYLSAMAQAKVLLRQGIITKKEFADIDTMMAKKHGLSLCSIFRKTEWINSEIRGNMSYEKEVKRFGKDNTKNTSAS